MNKEQQYIDQIERLTAELRNTQRAVAFLLEHNQAKRLQEVEMDFLYARRPLTDVVTSDVTSPEQKSEAEAELLTSVGKQLIEEEAIKKSFTKMLNLINKIV